MRPGGHQALDLVTAENPEHIVLHAARKPNRETSDKKRKEISLFVKLRLDEKNTRQSPKIRTKQPSLLQRDEETGRARISLCRLVKG